jgi:hypothetical protein
VPWFWREADELSRAEIDELTLRLLSEARSRLNKDLRRVLLLPPTLPAPTVAAAGSPKHSTKRSRNIATFM